MTPEERQAWKESLPLDQRLRVDAIDRGFRRAGEILAQRKAQQDQAIKSSESNQIAS